MANDRVEAKADMKTAARYMANGSMHHQCQNIESKTSSADPIVKTAGRTCTNLSDPGYNNFSVIRLIPNTCTCRQNLRKSTRRL